MSVTRLLLLLVLLLFNSCDNKTSFEAPPRQNGPEDKEPTSCENVLEINCDDKIRLTGNPNGCIWNVDKCEANFPTNLPSLPPNLPKIKTVEVGRTRACAIDFEDNLWCFSIASGHKDNILPHPSRKFLQISYNGNDFCGVNINGEGWCSFLYTYKKGQKVLEKVQTPEKIEKIFAGEQGRAWCAIAKSFSNELYCNGDSNKYEAFADFINAQVKKGTLSKPEFLAIRGDVEINYLAKNGVYNIYAIPENYISESFPDALSIPSTAEGQFECYINIKNKIKCGRIGSDYQLPTNVASAEVRSLAVAEDIVCAILTVENELVCWGKKTKTDLIPAGLKKIKKVSISQHLMCYINEANTLHCLSLSPKK